jgi:hypothetical protein
MEEEKQPSRSALFRKVATGELVLPKSDRRSPTVKYKKDYYTEESKVCSFGTKTQLMPPQEVARVLGFELEVHCPFFSRPWLLI